jgi:hypothetical protein
MRENAGPKPRPAATLSRSQEARRAREAEALRANLLKRKQQRRQQESAAAASAAPRPDEG